MRLWSPRARLRLISGIMTVHTELISAIGKTSNGMAMPEMMPSSESASVFVIPDSISRCGRMTDDADASRLLTTAAPVTGSTMPANSRPKPSGSGWRAARGTRICLR